MAKDNPKYRERVYAIVRRIPSGRVMTYGQIAELLGDGYTPRTVGFCMEISLGGAEDPAGDAQLEGIDAVQGQHHDPFHLSFTIHGTILSKVGNHAIFRCGGPRQAVSP